MRAALDSPARAARLRVVLPIAVTALAALVRLVGLSHPHAFVFDETYYVKDAWSLWNLGYEGAWPEDANERFLAGDTSAFTDAAAFVVHPPLGKWLIALGMATLGPETGYGWRIATAIAGTLTVLVLTLVVARMTGSPVWGAIAGGLLALDGLGIVLSRVALLDGFLTLLVLLAFWFVLLDRERALARIADDALRAGGPPPYGPVLWGRGWLVAAGVALGAAAAVKWSALWFLAAFGLYVVVSDALARRRAGAPSWFVDAVLRQGPVSFVLLVPVAVATYVASWTGWLVTSGGWGRDVSANPFAALWSYHVAVYDFHVGLSTDHQYASPAWQWPLLLRPTAMYWRSAEAGAPGCGFASGCAEAITSIPNPLVWYAAVIAVVALAALFALRRPRSSTVGIVLTAIAAGYLPWLAYPDRTIFQFYTVVLMPFLIMALVLCLRLLWQAAWPDARGRRILRIGVAVFLGACLALAIFWFPLWVGMPVPYDFWRLHTPITSWI